MFVCLQQYIFHTICYLNGLKEVYVFHDKITHYKGFAFLYYSSPTAALEAFIQKGFNQLTGFKRIGVE